VTMLYPKDRDEWLALRHQFVCSTESSALEGLNPYMTALELAVAKQQPEPTEFEASERMEWGLVLQRAIATQIARRYGVKVRALNGFAKSTVARMGASFDYQIVGEDDTKVEDDSLRIMYREHGPGVLEIKNVDSWVYREQWHDGEAPPHIELQVQHQLVCLGWKWAALGVLVGGNKLELLIRKYDDEVGKRLVKRVAIFWGDLERGKLPDPNLPADADIIKAIYHYAEPGKVADLQADEEFAALCKTIADANAVIKEATDRKEAAQASIILKIGDAEKALAHGYSVSAAMVAETEVKAYLRKAYRSIRVYTKKVK
jgi:putative phage-type endonuclease